MEVKTKFYCKCSQSTLNNLTHTTCKPKFIEGKWYDGAYETWSGQLFAARLSQLLRTREPRQTVVHDSGALGWSGKLNNGWKSYWVIDENGDKVKMNRAKMRIIFELDESKLRDIKIKNILYGKKS